MRQEQTTLLDGRVRLQQPVQGFRASIDCVFVAAAVPQKAKGRLLDLGCGVGSAGLCALARIPELSLCGVEVQPDLIEIAEKNALSNGLEGQTSFICSDMRVFPERGFDHVVCNPPFLNAGSWVRGHDEGRNMALGHGHDANLGDWIDQAFRCLKQRGSFSMIHRADILDEIMALTHGKFGKIEVWPLFPHAGEDAKRVVIRMVKDSKTPTALHSGIVLHEGDEYTPQANAILRDLQPLI